MLILMQPLQNLQIKTYQLNSNNQTSAGRISISSSGITGILFMDNGSYFITPIGDDYPNIHMVFNTRDLEPGSGMFCAVSELAANSNSAQANRLTAGDGQLRTYRLAVAATGEYTSTFGSQAGALVAITNTLNVVNAIYERDADIHFTLVTNNSILFTDAATDPYSTVTSPDNNTLSQNQTAITTAIGSSNYDLGIVLNNGWNGGLASVGVVCSSVSKGRAAAGINQLSPSSGYIGLQGPVFASTVAHEIAHQFSATHTYNATNGICGGQIGLSTAYEPGGGSTIMSYAGVCTPNYFQRQTDLYFHAGSLEQIQNYVLSGSGSCAVITNTGNTPPAVTVGAASYTIPKSTAFSLTAIGSDANSNILKYTWEEMDANFASSTAPLSTNTSGPNFRSYPPSTNPTRIFPSIDSLILMQSTYEVLSSVSRTMHFRTTVRDGAAGGGATAEADVAVVIDGTTGPFEINTQNSPVTLTANGVTTFTVGWNVNGTTGGSVNCATVDILFSTDGGMSFPNILVTNTANDGTQNIIVPNLPTSSGRVKVQAHSNIFFDINNANIRINSACIAEAAIITPAVNITAAAGSASLDLALSPAAGTPLTASGTISTTDPVANLVVFNSVSGKCTDFDQPMYYDTYAFTVDIAGAYTILRSTPDGLITNLYAYSFLPGTPCQNFITSMAIFDGISTSLSESFTVNLVPNTRYVLTIGSFNASIPALPANYTVSVNSAVGGTIYSSEPAPGTGYSYTYVIVEKSTGNIKAIDPGADLSNAGTYPSGTYTIYGLSYANASAAALAAFVGGSFAALQNSLLFNPSGTCGNLSKNSVTASVQLAVPLKLYPLKAYKVDKKVLLKWGTAFEQNTDRFDIERSSDGNQFTKVIGNVKAAGNSNVALNYDFTDQLPDNDNNFYRIKEFDIDGQFSYSNIAKINMKSSAVQFNLYPSPAISQLTLEFYSGRNENVMVEIFDSKGSIVSKVSMNMLLGTNTKTINVHHLSSGIYMMKLFTQNEVITRRFIKN